MTYTRNDIHNLIDAYTEIVGFNVSNTCTHLVTEDYNIDNHNIDYQLKWIEDHHTEWLADPDEGITQWHIDMSIAFLQLLKWIPEADRQIIWDDEDDEEDDPTDDDILYGKGNTAPLTIEPKWSEEWLKRHDK